MLAPSLSFLFCPVIIGFEHINLIGIMDTPCHPGRLSSAAKHPALFLCIGVVYVLSCF